MFNKDSTSGTLTVALVLCLVCSVLVSGAAVLLRPQQKLNKDLDVKSNILKAAGLYQNKESIVADFEKIEAKAVDLATGEFIENFDLAKFDQKKADSDAEYGLVIPKDLDVAKIGKRSKVSVVYFVRGESGYKTIIFPVKTKGLWSTMYGFLALDAVDLNTISGFNFYEHGETPGLGGEVENAEWKKLWIGKKIFNEEGLVKIKVTKGPGENEYEVDGLSGATITSNGVSFLFQYWFGQHGYGEFLKKLKMTMVAKVNRGEL
jgi:Na+-transporting NADH:ubiquinone oxidoreductase subunit C